MLEASVFQPCAVQRSLQALSKENRLRADTCDRTLDSSNGFGVWWSWVLDGSSNKRCACGELPEWCRRSLELVTPHFNVVHVMHDRHTLCYDLHAQCAHMLECFVKSTNFSTKYSLVTSIFCLLLEHIIHCYCLWLEHIIHCDTISLTLTNSFRIWRWKYFLIN